MDERTYEAQMNHLISKHLEGTLDEQAFDRQTEELVHRQTERILAEALIGSREDLHETIQRSSGTVGQFLHDPSWFVLRILCAITLPIMFVFLFLWLSAS